MIDLLLHNIVADPLIFGIISRFMRPYIKLRLKSTLNRVFFVVLSLFLCASKEPISSATDKIVKSFF